MCRSTVGSPRVRADHDELGSQGLAQVTSSEERKDRSKSSVDWEAHVYAAGKQMNVWPYSEVISAVMREFGAADRDSLSALEIGCGAGNNLWFLASAGFKVAGIDRSSTAITHARERLLKLGYSPQELRVGDIERLPWADGSFDLVLDRGALTQNEHAQIEIILSEVRRVLKPDGIFLGFTLFGLDHPDRQYGTELSHHCYDQFSRGRFLKVGLSAFFDVADLDRLFAPFGDVRITRHRCLDGHNRLIDDEFSVRARNERSATE